MDRDLKDLAVSSAIFAFIGGTIMTGYMGGGPLSVNQLLVGQDSTFGEETSYVAIINPESIAPAPVILEQDEEGTFRIYNTYSLGNIFSPLMDFHGHERAYEAQAKAELIIGWIEEEITFLESAGQKGREHADIVVFSGVSNLYEEKDGIKRFYDEAETIDFSSYQAEIDALQQILPQWQAAVEQFSTGKSGFENAELAEDFGQQYISTANRGRSALAGMFFGAVGAGLIGAGLQLSASGRKRRAVKNAFTA